MSKVTPPDGAGWERLTVKLKVAVPELPSLLLTSFTLNALPITSTCVTVSVAGLLLTVVVPSLAVAVMCAVPSLWVPTFAVATPVAGLVEVESMVATDGLSEMKLIGTFVIVRPN